MNNPKHIILSRTDSIGDVILTMPIAGFLKEKYPHCKISFLGKSYTEAVVKLSSFIDKFLNWEEIQEMVHGDQVNYIAQLEADWIIHIFPNKKIAHLAKEAGIENRVGTSHRLHHFTTCNHRPNFTRKNSDLHESQLNFILLKPLIGDYMPDKDAIFNWYGFTKVMEKNWIKHLMDEHRYNLILHPKSQGSAREWGLDNFTKLINILPEDRYNIYVTGTKEEAAEMKDFLEEHHERINDVTGQFTLDELIAFINYADGLVAASTGPLHIAAALGKRVVGLYAPMRPIHPGRWEPIGPNARALVIDKDCSDCKKDLQCECIRSIKPGHVLAALEV